ncbi:MAG: hypothetical protein CVV45_06590 [Spirochaetae bacterium HGW-Spirochaetae-10]|nr:MAG: hypothetical protein CVV45_06590 [Spirochaetae bacterium HGW-Spirochaetae-10]
MLSPEGFHQVDFRGFLLETQENERRKVRVNKDRHIVSSRNVSNSLVNSAPLLRNDRTYDAEFMVVRNIAAVRRMRVSATDSP